MQSLIWLIGGVVVIEVFALVLKFFDTGRLFYSRAPEATGGSETPADDAAATPERAENGAPNTETMSARMVLHPYFGYCFRPGMKAREWIVGDWRKAMVEGGADDPDWLDVTVTDLGTWSRYPFPYKRKGKEFIVAITGGSVAQWFSLAGHDTLRDTFVGMGLCKAEDFVLVNFAMGGGKQPQALQSIAYALSCGHDFDVVLNLDGMNEVFSGVANLRNGLHPSMPGVYQIDSLKSYVRSGYDRENMGALAEYALRRQQFNSLKRRRRRNPFAAIDVVLDYRQTFVEGKMYDAYRQLTAASDDKQTDMLNLLGGYVPNLTRDAVGGEDFDVKTFDFPDEESARTGLAPTVDVWADASLQLARLCAANGIAYVHALQPSFYATRKPISDGEKANGYEADPVFAKMMRYAYPMLIQRGRELQRGEVNFVWETTALFDMDNRTLFCDWAGHMNVRGNEIVAQFLAQRVASAIAR